MTEEKINKKKKKAGSAKGIETMYRNAYRAQLDFIALAATKANIMISLNGFIVSILFVSGGIYYKDEPIMLIPIALFMVTSGISIYFALTSASPSVNPLHKKLVPCLKDLFAGRVRLAEFAEFLKLPKKDFDPEQSNILIFEESDCLSRKEYSQQMNRLLHNKEQVYDKMSDQLYWMGNMANRKFAMLRYSYSSFRWGLSLSILLFVMMKISLVMFPDYSQLQTHVAAKTNILNFKTIYEPSGVVQLKDGRIIVIEDEPEKPWHVLTMTPNGQTSFERKLSTRLRKAFKKELSDLEAITPGPDGFIYAITSHSRNKKDERDAKREQLIRFKINNDKIVEQGIYRHLIRDFDEAGILGDVDKTGRGGLFNLDIEALSFDSKNRLMLGLRSPQINGRTVLAVIENPTELFKEESKAIISPDPILLRFHGGGIRDLIFDVELDGYLLTNEIYGDDNKKISQLLFWDGEPDHHPQKIDIPGLNNMRNIEGISPVIIDNEKYILLVSDNGDRKRKEGAEYLLLKYHYISHEQMSVSRSRVLSRE